MEIVSGAEEFGALHVINIIKLAYFYHLNITQTQEEYFILN